MRVGQRTLAEVDAVTIDGYGTLLRLVDPVPKLQELVPDKSVGEVEAAFRVEGRYYLEHSLDARDQAGLTRLHEDCTAVFNEALGSKLTPNQYIGALEFEVLPRVPHTLERLRACGVALAVVANWDISLHTHLTQHRLRHYFDAVVISAEVGARKPDPLPFQEALRHLSVAPERAIHVGDHRPHDQEGAAAAGMRFMPAPLERIFDR